jgi:hypothetical protein
MAYTALADSKVDLDSPIDTDLMTALRGNQRALRLMVFPVNFAEATTTSTGYVTLATFALAIPSFPDESGVTRQVRLELDATRTVNVQAKASAGTVYLKSLARVSGVLSF